MLRWLAVRVALLEVLFISLIASFSLSAPAMADIAPPAPPPDVRIVVIHRPGPAWVAGVSFNEQVGVNEHVAHYKALLEDGTLMLGGPFLDDTGGMMVSVPSAGLEPIKAHALADPAVQSGLLTVEVHPWFIAMWR